MYLFKTSMEMSSAQLIYEAVKVEGHPNPGLFNHEYLNHGVEKFMVEKSGVEKSGIEKSGVEMSFNLLDG